MRLTNEQTERKEAVIEFAKKKIIPVATEYDEKESYPVELIRDMGKQGFLCPHIPKEYGGGELDMYSIGLINEQIGQASASVRSILTVQGMVGLAILKYGTKRQKDTWLPKLSSGEIIAGFALAEEKAGCNSSSLSTSYHEIKKEYELNGKKTWVTMGQLTNLFLVFARRGEEFSAFLVEREREGVKVDSVKGLLGLRATMVADVTFSNVRIPKENLLGSVGVGLRFIVPLCLDYGRYTVAWGCVGLSQACVNECFSYANQREQFGSKIKDFQMIQRMLAKMVALTKSSRLMCWNAAERKEDGDFNSILETCITKYYASTVANEVASMAVQIFGANGCKNQYPVERYFRDAKISEIIEGSTQILEIMIANNYWED